MIGCHLRRGLIAAPLLFFLWANIMATVELTQSNFEQTINGNDVVIVDFWAPWCGPCRAFAPVYEAAAEKHPGVVFAKVNTEEEQQLAASFNIRSIPTLMIFREQIILFSQPGSLPGPPLDDLIGKIMELDMAMVRKEIAEEQTKNA
jgi:thioredoxin 1